MAMVEAATERGYAEVTIADVVRHAHVSKRTFYEHFPDKESCFLAAYMAVAAELLGRIATAAAQEARVEDRIIAAAKAYFASLEANPAVTRTFLSDIHAAGPKAIELRRKIHQQFADTLRMLVESERIHMTNVRPLSRELATAIVGGINELIMLAIEEGRGARLNEVADAAIQLVFAVLRTLPQPADEPLPIPGR
jgi:AcrR family transcriptional regulator